MKQLAARAQRAAPACVAASGCIAREATPTQSATQAGEALAPNRAVAATMTCGVFKALLKDDRRTSGTAILWLDGYYSGRSGLTDLLAG
jgi:hypothetical protein